MALGAEESALTTQGDILYYGEPVPRLPIRNEGQVLSEASKMVFRNGKTLAVTRCIYVAGGIGADNPPTNGVTLDRPFKTIRYACEEIEAGA